jgi:hypothetical protein
LATAAGIDMLILNASSPFGKPAWSNDALSVALDSGDGCVIVVSQGDEVWSHVLSASDEEPRSHMSSKQWSSARIAGEGEPRVEILGVPP